MDEIFHYSPNKGKPQDVYFKSQIVLFEVTGSQNKQVGTFVLSILNSSNVPVITVCKQGATSIVSYPISKSTKWLPQNEVYCYSNDKAGRMWLFQFPDQKTLSNATAVFSVLLCVRNSQQSVSYTLNQGDGKPLELGDCAKVKIHSFSVTQLPMVGDFKESIHNKVKLGSSKIPDIIADALIGLSLNGAKFVYNQGKVHIIYVFHILQVKPQEDTPSPQSPLSTPTQSTSERTPQSTLVKTPLKETQQDTLRDAPRVGTQDMKDTSEEALHAAVTDCIAKMRENANRNAVGMVKKMMSDVFSDIGERFVPGESYSGDEINEALFSIFRKHSFEVFERINSGGLSKQ